MRRSSASTRSGVSTGGTQPARYCLSIAAVMPQQACTASPTVRMPRSRNFGTSAWKMRAAVTASPRAEWRPLTSTLSQAATVSSAPSARSGSVNSAKSRVSRTRGPVHGRPARSHSRFSTARSNPSACPTHKASPTNAVHGGQISANAGADETAASSMPCTLVTAAGIGTPGRISRRKFASGMTRP